MFSSVSLWEIAIKASRGRVDFQIDAGVLRRGLFDNGYAELAMTGAHAAGLAGLPPIHRDPFDRMLIAQAAVEGLTLLTSDRTVAKYPGPIRACDLRCWPIAAYIWSGSSPISAL